MAKEFIMESQVAAAAASKGTLASVGSSLLNVGSTTTAFAVAHPIGLAVTGGAFLGVGAYLALGKMFRKKDKEPVLVEEAMSATA